jgi:hypothetical protein
LIEWHSANKLVGLPVSCSFTMEEFAMIKAPRATGEYSLRGHDCRKAMERPANMVLRDSGAPFVDFASLLHAILPEATAAGWDEREVEIALEQIVRDLRPIIH